MDRIREVSPRSAYEIKRNRMSYMNIPLAAPVFELDKPSLSNEDHRIERTNDVHLGKSAID